MTTMLANRDIRLRIAAIAIAIIILALAFAYRIFGMHGIADTFTRGNGTATSQATSGTTNAIAITPQTISGTSSATDALTQALFAQYGTSTSGGSDSLNAAIAGSIQVEAPTYRTFTVSDLTVVPDSADHAAAYKAAVNAAYAPMRQNTDPEIAVYTRMMDGDASAEGELQQIIVWYGAADAAAAAVAVPHSAVSVHLAALNALSHYTASLASLLAHKDDPVASVLLMRDYNEAEQEMFDSFDALHAYLATSTAS